MIDYLYPLSFLIITYLVSSIPFGLLISKIFLKSDIREHGSKNIGATNVTRVLGKKYGLLTFILDALKGAAMVLLAKIIFDNLVNLDQIILLTAFIAVFGHIFPIYLKFKGGKGVATTVAVILVVNPLIGLLNIIIWFLVFLISKISAIAALSSIIAVNIAAIYLDITISEQLLYLSLLILIVFRHKENIIRLKNGTENKV